MLSHIFNRVVYGIHFITPASGRPFVKMNGFDDNACEKQLHLFVFEQLGFKAEEMRRTASLVKIKQIKRMNEINCNKFIKLLAALLEFYIVQRCRVI